MRHRIKGRKFNRTASHKKALMRNLANQLFEHKEIKTTTAKAKEARGTVERLITYAKKGDSHHRRLAFAFLRNKETIKILFDEIATAFKDRQGGYTRVLKLGRRQGDGAFVSILQLVGFEKLSDSSKPEKKKKAPKKETAGATAAVGKDTTEVKAKESKPTDEPEEIQEAEVVESVPTEPVVEETPQEEQKSEEESLEPPETESEKPAEEDKK